MSQENVDIVRRNYEVINSIGRTGDQFIDPEDVAARCSLENLPWLIAGNGEIALAERGRTLIRFSA